MARKVRDGKYTGYVRKILQRIHDANGMVVGPSSMLELGIQKSSFYDIRKKLLKNRLIRLQEDWAPHDGAYRADGRYITNNLSLTRKGLEFLKQ